MAAPTFPPMDNRWRAILRGESPAARGARFGRRVFAALPAHSRCYFCHAPFDGPGRALRFVGYGQSRKNPHLCARCLESAPAGGAVIPVSVLFADVRGYTSMTEKATTLEVTALLQRFYAAASTALLLHEAVLGQIAGDEVMAIFVPGLAGAGYRTSAVAAGRSLLQAMGYTTPESNWLDVGVGVSSGEEYVGNVGGGGFKDFTAIGDVTNTAARLQAHASGDLVVDAPTYEAVAHLFPGAERCEFQLKGKELPVVAFRIAVS
jgi:adenylate cyclase